MPEASHDEAEYERAVLRSVAEYGWHGVLIEDDAEGLAFEYTVGLMVARHPELIVFGLPRAKSHGVLWNIVREIRDGRRFDAAGLYEDILEGCACAIRPIDESRFPEYLGYAMWHQRHVGQIGILDAVQCFWPDRSGLFPWEDGCEPFVVQSQPLLYERAG